MSGISLNNKLQKVYSKVSNKVGFEFSVYRSLDYINPVQPRNFFKKLNVAYSIDDKFLRQQEYSFNLYNIFVDTNIYQPGDIFVKDNITMTLVATQEIAVPKGIISSNNISIYRPKYSTTGGFKPTRELLFDKVPAQVMSTNSSQTSGNTANVTQMKSAVQEWDIWVWLPVGSILPNDAIVDEYGNDMLIKSISVSELGYKLHCVSTKL